MNEKEDLSLRTNRTEKYKCKYCGLKFRLKIALLKHEAECHLNFKSRHYRKI